MMSEKLKEYQVIDVFCGGTFYKVRHKVTNNIFAWKAYNCSTYSDEQIQNVVNEVKTISKATSDNLLRYYDTILHAPSKTLYFVLEYNSWRSVHELFDVCKATDKHFAESFIWRLLHELARVCKVLEDINVIVLRKCIKPVSIYVGESGELRVDCFDLALNAETSDPMRQVGEVIETLCYRAGACDDKTKEFHYSDDLGDVVSFLTDYRNVNLRPDVVLYHPTVLANLETLSGLHYLSEILIPAGYSHPISEVNKCDSEKAVELSRAVEPMPRTIFYKTDSPIYSNISLRRIPVKEIEETHCDRGSLSPTLAALALELPGFVPRSYKPYTKALEVYNCPQRVSEETLSQQWMSRLMALRQREESLNQRERILITKELVTSPTAKVIPLKDLDTVLCESNSNGITLPPAISQATHERRERVSRRRPRRRGSICSRGQRKSYENLDSSLSADDGDSSMIITATKFTKENMPRRNIFPDISTKKVHFTSANPFAESDESVTLTFYELNNVKDGSQGSQPNKEIKDITKFKYLDSEKNSSEKRSAMPWSHSSPSKQAKFTKNAFKDISNQSSIRKTPSKASLTSRNSSFSRNSVMSLKSQWSVDMCQDKSGVFERTHSSIKQSLAQTPSAPVIKKKIRKSLLQFKTPFKFSRQQKTE